MKSISLIITLLLFFQGRTNAQGNIQWSEWQKVKDRIRNVYPISGSSFYVLDDNLGLSMQTNFVVTAQHQMTMSAEGRREIIEGMTTVGSDALLFFSSRDKTTNRIYAQLFGTDCKPKGTPIQLSEFEMPKSWGRGEFKLLQSENNEFFGIEYNIPATKTTEKRSGYTILDRKLNVVSKGEYTSPADASQWSIYCRLLSGRGEYYQVVRTFKVNEKGQKTGVADVVLLHFSGDQKNETLLEFEDNSSIIFQMAVSEFDDKFLTFSGLYFADKGETSGALKLQFDLATKKFVKSDFHEFEKGFIVPEYIAQEYKKKAAERAESGKNQKTTPISRPRFIPYQTREILALKDGSLIGVFEQEKMETITSTDSKGSQTITYNYLFENVIVYKMSADGKLLWAKKIPKRELSVNDDGYRGSVACYLDGEKIVLIFNDCPLNYDERGNYDVPDDEIPFSSSFPTLKKYHAVAKVEIGLVEGSVTRTRFFNDEEMEAPAVPKVFSISYDRNEVLMLSHDGKKIRFGLLKF